MKNKVLFIGLGGAGQRHLRIFKKLMPQAEFFALRSLCKTPTLDSSFNVLENKNLEDIYKINIFKDEALIEKIKPEITVVSVPNSLHSYYVNLSFKNNSNLLLEKPGIIDPQGVEILKNTYMNSNLIFRVGYQRKYSPLYKIFKDLVINNCELITEINVKVSSFIPDWHPYEDFKSLYACRNDLGGGVLFTETHEINMIIELFGLPENWSHNLMNLCNSNLEVADSCESRFYYKNFPVNFDLSFFRKPSMRTINVNLKNGNIKFDIDKSILQYEINEKSQTLQFNLDNDYLFVHQALDFLKFNIRKSKNDIKNELIFEKIIKN